MHTKLVPKFFMTFGSPELAGIPSLAQMVFMVTNIPQQNSNKRCIGSIHCLCNVLFAFSIHFLWQFHGQLHQGIFYYASRPFLYMFGCIIYLINYHISLITFHGCYRIAGLFCGRKFSRMAGICVFRE